MLCHSHHHLHSPTTTIFHGRFTLSPNSNPNPNPNPSLPPVNLHFHPPSSHQPLISSIHAHEPNNNNNNNRTTASAEELDEANSSLLSGRQNARSTGLLLCSRSRIGANEPRPNPDGEQQEELPLREKIVEEASLATRRIPRFPGSIDFPETERLDRPPPYHDHRALHQALELRRGVAAEVLKEALRAGKLSITYCANLVGCLLEFVDRIMVGAVAMKAVPESSHLSFNARAKSYIKSSGVVALVKIYHSTINIALIYCSKTIMWLKHNQLTFPQIGRVICMCSGDLEQVMHICEWLKAIHVKGESLGVVLVKAGPIWERSSDTLEEIVYYLKKNGVRRDWVGFVVSRCPQVLALTMEELESRVEFFLDMGMSEKDFGTMVFDYPRVLGFFSLEEMNSKVKYLKEFGLSNEDVGRLLISKPQLMGCSIEERWKPLVKYLYYLGVHRDGMKRILEIKPMVFCIDLETTIAPKVRFLQDIGIREDAIGGVLVKFPHLLTYSLYKKIRPVVIFLMTKAGVTQSEIGKVIASDPQLVGCSIIEKLEVNTKYFLSLGIRLQSLGEMIADFPMLLRYNLDVLRPKYRYLRRIMVRPLQHLIEFPRFLSYSLDGRIVPRHKIAVANRINFKLREMLACSDEVFDGRVQAAVEERERFESGGEEHTNFFCSDSEPSHTALSSQEWESMSRESGCQSAV